MGSVPKRLHKSPASFLRQLKLSEIITSEVVKLFALSPIFTGVCFINFILSCEIDVLLNCYSRVYDVSVVVRGECKNTCDSKNR